MKAVLVTTQHRGVFFGYVEEMPETLPGSIELRNCRNCIYWSADIKGFIGLAVSGPSSDCRIGPAVENITLYDVTSVAKVTDAAMDKWESSPWR